MGGLCPIVPLGMEATQGGAISLPELHHGREHGGDMSLLASAVVDAKHVGLCHRERLSGLEHPPSRN
eukprot:m.16287 g.16287  ORF g.16287 m.16287 type:complete len:67 (-) comp5036_c0_seq1:547-747(-)